MSTNFPFFLSRANEQLHAIRKNWYWLFGLGIALILIGILSIGYPAISTLTTVEVFGYLLLISGAIQIASAIWAIRWGGFLLHLLGGLLYLFLGAVIIERPELGAAGYTLLLAMFFVAAGLFRIVFALSAAQFRELLPPGAPTLAVDARELFARGNRRVLVEGPCPELEVEARAVHAGFWRQGYFEGE